MAAREILDKDSAGQDCLVRNRREDIAPNERMALIRGYGFALVAM